MAAIDRTAYPRFKRVVPARELVEAFTPTVGEVAWAREKTQNDQHLLALVVWLKSYQRLGYFPKLDEVPAVVVGHVRGLLDLSGEVRAEHEADRTATWHRGLVRALMGVEYDAGRARVIAEESIRRAVTTTGNPADLINVALELVRVRCELPGFSTLDRLVAAIRAETNTALFALVAARIDLAAKARLTRLLWLDPTSGRSEFDRLKTPTLGKFKLRLVHLRALDEFGGTEQWLDGIPATGLLAQRITRQHPQIQQMLGQGRTISAIARELHLDRKTVRRYARSEVEGLLSSGVRRASLIDPFVPYLQHRWREGCMNAAVLYSEIAAQGFGGSVKTVRRHLQHWRVAGVPVQIPPTITPRKAAGWLMRRRDDLTDEERERLRAITDRCDEIAATADLATEFATLLRHLRGAELEAWAQRAQASGVREISSFATTLHRDWDAVVAGLTLPHSNGPTEGNVNRLKLIKRAMYGRAQFDLHRLRVLAAS